MAVIQSISAFTVPYLEPNDHGSTRYVCLVKLVDSDGIEGWGEAVTLFSEATKAVEALLDGYGELLRGIEAEASTVEKALAEATWWYGDSGIACFAAAALDLALWDIRGKREHRSLLDMVGAAQESMRTVVTCHATDADLSRMAAGMAETVRAQSAIGIKVGFGKRGDANLGFDHDRDVEFTRLLRRELGDAARLMIDIGARIHWTPSEAIDRVLAFEQYSVHWTEEPLGADDPEGYRQLKDSTHSLIAYGEREWTSRGYARIIATGTVDVIGIDPGRARGVSGFLAALETAASSGIQANAHAFAGPITFAASLALSQSSLACRQLEQMPLRNSLYDLVDGAPVAVNGTVRASDAHGLGISVDESAVRRASAGSTSQN